MPKDIDPNVVAATVITELVKQGATSLAGTLKLPFAKIGDAYQYSFKHYLSNTLARCSKVKTFLNKDEPVNLLDTYVETTFNCGKKHYTDIELIETLEKLKTIVVLGSAGCGKSMFMRYLLVSLCQQPSGRMPLFVELRNFTGFHTKELIPFLYHSVTKPGGVLTEDQFKMDLRAGRFYVILDGFDEIDHDERKVVEEKILDLRTSYPNTIIIVSSREDERFTSWSNFYLFHVKPLDKRHVITLIQKSNYDNEIKRKFAKAVKEKLYDMHKSFLSNPLLAVMMLITFKEIAHIPEKLHIFYDEAFAALYFKHDASKEAAFRRKSYSNLPIDEFKHCLSCFSISTYLKERFSFTDAQFKEDMATALKLAKSTVNPEDFARDLLESVCVLQKDGLETVFSHRSFQEYFSALFIARSSPAAVLKLLTTLCRRYNDIVIRLAFDMNRNLIEREWVVPVLNRIIDATANIADEDVLGYFMPLYGPMHLMSRNQGATLQFTHQEPTELGLICGTMFRLYPDRWKSLRWGVSTDDRKIIIAALAKAEMTKLLRVDGTVQLEPADNEWLRNTSVRDYVTSHRSHFRRLRSDVVASLKSQDIMLEGLIGSTSAL